MNIIMVTNTYPPRASGVARSVATFTDHYRRQGHQARVITPHTSSLATTETDIIRLPAIPLKDSPDLAAPLPLPRVLTAALKNFQPDIIHSHHPFLLGITAVRLASHFNVPLVFTHHTMYDYSTPTAADYPSRLQKFVKNLVTSYANICTTVFAPSPSTAHLLRGRGVHRPIKVVPTGIEIKKFAPQPKAIARQRFNIPPKAFVVGYVGRLALEKNLIPLATIIARFLQSHPAAWSMIVGSGRLTLPLQKIFQGHGVDQRVRFPGKLKDDDLIAAYHSLDIFAFTSLSETQGLVLLEALAAGVPIIAFDAPGAREIVVPNKNGWLIAPGDNESFITQLHMASQLPRYDYGLLQKQAVATANRYDAAACASRALSIYQQLIEDHTRHKASTSTATGRRLAMEWQLWLNRWQAARDAFVNVKNPEVAYKSRN